MAEFWKARTLAATPREATRQNRCEILAVGFLGRVRTPPVAPASHPSGISFSIPPAACRRPGPAPRLFPARCLFPPPLPGTSRPGSCGRSRSSVIRSIFWTSVRSRKCRTRRRNTAASSSVSCRSRPSMLSMSASAASRIGFSRAAKFSAISRLGQKILPHLDQHIGMAGPGAMHVQRIAFQRAGIRLVVAHRESPPPPDASSGAAPAGRRGHKARPSPRAAPRLSRPA